MTNSYSWIPLWEFPIKETHPEGPWQEVPSDELIAHTETG